MKTYDVVVIGAGGVGSAAMRELAKRGLRVLGVDRFSPPHTRGSSHGETRVIRQAYFEHASYVPLLDRAYESWRELEAESGATLMHQCGLLEVGPDDGEVVPGVLSAAELHSLKVETLTDADVRRRWQGLQIPDGLAAVFEPTAGYLHVESCVETSLREAQRFGATLNRLCEVRRWQMVEGLAEIDTTQGLLRSKNLVITAGAWSSDLLNDLGVPLTPLRKSLFWYPTGGMPSAMDLPVYLYELPHGIWYGFPSLDGRSIKVGEHTGGLLVNDPLMVNRNIVPVEQSEASRFVSECIPQAGGDPLDHATCLYTMTPDHHFVVDRHPHHANVVFAAGLSGHGFKFAPVLGEALADLVTEGTTSLPIDFLSAARLQRRD